MFQNQGNEIKTKASESATLRKSNAKHVFKNNYLYKSIAATE